MPRYSRVCGYRERFRKTGSLLEHSPQKSFVPLSQMRADTKRRNRELGLLFLTARVLFPDKSMEIWQLLREESKAPMPTDDTAKYGHTRPWIVSDDFTAPLSDISEITGKESYDAR